MLPHVIRIEPLAPVKPATGSPCNGCGVCCLAEPCPLGMLVSRRRHGRCSALRWQPAGAHYRCALITAPSEVLRLGSSRFADGLAWVLARLARRWTAAGRGCDSSAEAAH